MTVPHRVHNRLPADAKRVGFNARRARAWCAVHGEDEPRTVSGERFTRRLKRTNQTSAVEHGRPQVPDRLPRLSDALIERVANGHELRVDAWRGVPEAPRRGFELQRRAADSLKQRVVDFAAQAKSLRIDDRQ